VSHWPCHISIKVESGQMRCSNWRNKSRRSRGATAALYLHSTDDFYPCYKPKLANIIIDSIRCWRCILSISCQKQWTSYAFNNIEISKSRYFVFDYNSWCVLRNKVDMLYNCLFTFSSQSESNVPYVIHNLHLSCT